MTEETVEITLERSTSRHMSCKQLREKIESESYDENSLNYTAKRELDEKYNLLNII